MRRALVERSLRDVHARLERAREELGVLDEQLAVLNDAADDARIRSLVSETPLAGTTTPTRQRSADAANRGRASLLAMIGDLSVGRTSSSASWSSGPGRPGTSADPDR